MFSVGGFAFASAMVIGIGFGAHAHVPTVPQAELAKYCQMVGPGVHQSTYFTDSGIRLVGHADCNAVTFTLSEILPPLDEEILPGTAQG